MALTVLIISDAVLYVYLYPNLLKKKNLPTFYAVFHFINDSLFIEVLSKLLGLLTKFKAGDEGIIKV
jgi:hypothetical protein